MDIKKFLDSKQQLLKDENNNVLILYHGTNREFSEHDIKKHRTLLNSKFQGDWICYTDNYETAIKYMTAARNQCFDKDLFFKDIDLFFDKRPFQGFEKYLNLLIKELVHKGYQQDQENDTYENIAKLYIKDNNIITEDPVVCFFQQLNLYISLYNFNIDEISDILEYVEGSKINNSPDMNFNFFNNTTIDIPMFAINYLIENEFLNSIPKPIVLSSQITYSKCLKTDDREEAKNAKNLGYDLVIYNGEGCVDNSPEYLIIHPNQVSIIKIDKYQKRIEYLDEYKTSWIEHIELLESQDKKHNKQLKI